MPETIQNPEVTLTPQEQVDLLKANTVSKEQFDNLQQQYNTLFKAYTERPAPAEIESELTPEQQVAADKEAFDANCKIFQENYSKSRHTFKDDYELTKAMLDADDYFRKYHGKSVFESQVGNSTEEADIVNKGVELARYAMEQSQGDPNVFATLFNKHLI